MKAIFNFFYALIFIGLVALTFAALYVLAAPVFNFLAICLGLTLLRHFLGLRNALTQWATWIMISVDQAWQVLFAPLLNIGVNTEHKFGAPDETASSVVGKNLKATGELRWKVIEVVLSIVLEGGKPHAIPAIELDEGASKHKGSL